VPIGTPVTIRYTADSRDSDPDPRGAWYAASQATVEFPDFTIVTDGTFGLSFRVALGDGTSVQLLQYLTAFGTYWGMSIPFSFPAGTLTSDELPLTLPLANANLARFHLFPIVNDIYAGDITSYTAVEIPEPSVPLMLAAGSIALRVRKRIVSK
jgi:hypothetical protein